ncbi:MAG: patatin-like phospholipase family protein [Betaproteobacteria bacterium]|nr:patatin-like phospholipase family protein [Betaproteobacteria bacterium]
MIDPLLPVPQACVPNPRRAALLRGFAALALGVLLAGCQSAPPAVTTAPPAAPPTAPAPSVPAAPSVKHVPRLGLALGGGAARGFAHIGVIQVLEENGFYPQLVAGTSAGSLVAALYTAGNNGAALQRLAADMDESALTDWTFPLRGLIKGEALAQFVRQQTSGKLIEQMSVPLGVVATDLATGNPVLFRRGDTGTAVRASSAVPSMFEPVQIGTHEYVDGGLTSPVPVRFAREMGAQVVVAVDISTPPSGQAPHEALGMLLQTFAIMGRSINHWELRTADVVIRPQLDGMKGTDFASRLKAIEAGRAAALAALPAIRLAMAPR